MSEASVLAGSWSLRLEPAKDGAPIESLSAPVNDGVPVEASDVPKGDENSKSEEFPLENF